MAHLSRNVVRTAQQIAVDDRGRADAGSLERQIADVEGRMPPILHAAFPDQGCLAVVFHRGRKAEDLLGDGADRHVGPVQLRRKQHNIAVDAAHDRDSDAFDAVHAQPGLAAQVGP